MVTEPKDLDLFKTKFDSEKPPEKRKLSLLEFMQMFEKKLKSIQGGATGLTIDLHEIIFLFNLADIACEMKDDLRALHRPPSQMGAYEEPGWCQKPCVYCSNLKKWNAAVEQIESRLM